MSTSRTANRQLIEILRNLQQKYFGEILMVYDLLTNRATFLDIFVNDISDYVSEEQILSKWKFSKDIINFVDKVKMYPRYKVYRDKMISKKLNKLPSYLQESFKLIEG